MQRSWLVILAGMGLLGLLAWTLRPWDGSRMPGPKTKPAPSSNVFPSASPKTVPPKPVMENKHTRPPEEIETGSGKEIPGEKLVQFPSAEAYRKFLSLAPPGMVLGQIEALHSVRVKSGAWLADPLAQAGGSSSGNFYVRVPEVPLEVREKGDALYQAVRKKALDLIGAENVTENWGRGVKVALMDTPLEGMEKVEGETAGHGTAMRSLIQGQLGAARGAAPGAEVVPFAVLDQEGKGSSFRLAEGIVRATDQGARVINMSLGSDGDSPVVRDAVAYALGRNVVLVAAAGNEAVNRVSYPAAYEGVVAVGSVDAGGQPLYFSNRGSQVAVVAPGYAVVAAWPGQKFVEVSGTSASTALTSGAVAALLSREAGLTGSQAARLLSSYADDVGAPGRDDESGAGVVNLQRILERNQRGIVDVAVAGVTMKEDGNLGKITAGVQNRGTETVNSLSLEITAGGERRKFYFGSLAPGQTAAEALTFDLSRARLEGGIAAGASAEVRGDQRPENDLWTGYFRISKEK